MNKFCNKRNVIIRLHTDARQSYLTKIEPEKKMKLRKGRARMANGKFGNHWGISNSYTNSNNILNISFRRMVWLEKRYHRFMISMVLCFCGRPFWRVICFGSIVFVSIVSDNNFVSGNFPSFMEHENLFRRRSELNPWANPTRSIPKKIYIYRDEVWRARKKRKIVRASGSVDGGWFNGTIFFFYFRVRTPETAAHLRIVVQLFIHFKTFTRLQHTKTSICNQTWFQPDNDWWGARKQQYNTSNTRYKRNKHS